MDFSKKEDHPQSEEHREAFARNVLRNKYHLVRKLYEEEFEIVYLAESKDIAVPTNCLIQQFTPQYISQAQSVAAKHLFHQEATILNNLSNHPQIPSIYDYFEIQGQFFVVQEFILGQSLQEELSKAQPYNQTEIIEFLNNILPILEFIHKYNYIHRDIKPSHLMRNYVNHKIYLINFYSIKEKINPQNLDITGQFMPHLTVGTQGYIPMEQHLGRPEFCSDIYALGIVAIQALTQIELTQLLYDEHNNPRWHHLLSNIADFNPQLLEIIDTMVRCNHRQRYQSAIAIIASLKKLNSTQKVTEHTLIIENSDSTTQDSEPTLIVTNTETSSVATERTLIMPSNDLETTRIISSNIVSDQNNNSPKDENKISFKVLAIIGAALVIFTIISILLIFKNNQKSEPQYSFLTSLSVSPRSSFN